MPSQGMCRHDYVTDEDAQRRYGTQRVEQREARVPRRRSEVRRDLADRGLPAPRSINLGHRARSVAARAGALVRQFGVARRVRVTCSVRVGTKGKRKVKGHFETLAETKTVTLAGPPPKK